MPTTSPIAIDGSSLTFEQVLAIATGEPGVPKVVLTNAAQEQVARAADAVQQLLREGRIAYGITTGFGAFKDRVIPREQVEQLQRNILVSHGNFSHRGEGIQVLQSWNEFPRARSFSSLPTFRRRRGL